MTGGEGAHDHQQKHRLEHSQCGPKLRAAWREAVANRKGEEVRKAIRVGPADTERALGRGDETHARRHAQRDRDVGCSRQRQRRARRCGGVP